MESKPLAMKTRVKSQIPKRRKVLERSSRATERLARDNIKTGDDDSFVLFRAVMKLWKLNLTSVFVFPGFFPDSAPPPRGGA